MDLTDEIITGTLTRAGHTVNQLKNHGTGTYTQLPRLKGNWWWIMRTDEMVIYSNIDRKYLGFYVCEQLSELLAYCVLKDITPKRI